MTKQVKVFFVFIAVAAVVSVLSFSDIFRAAKSVKFSESGKPLPLDLSEDHDQDGLSDTDESYWNTDFQNPDTDGDGFLDGEEVASGFDPRESSSHELGDSLSDTVYGSVKTVQAGDFANINFTDDVTELLLGGIGAGDLGREADPQKSDNSLAVLADSTIGNFYKSLPVFSPEALNVADSSEENQIKYLESLAQTIKNDLLDFPEKLDTDQNPFTQGSYFLNRANKLKLSRDNTSQLSVPENWVETHKKIIDLLNRFYLNHDAIGRYEEDAIKAVIAFNAVEGLNAEIKVILKETQEKIKINNLKPGDVVFGVMDIIYKF